MTLRAASLLLVTSCYLVGCGGAAANHGTATLWVTRDRGAHVLLVARVPAGLTAMQALDRKADLHTRYGGRFVQSIDGIDGSLGARRDWFWFVNGIEGDRSAADYRLRPGDIEWWDYRSWAGRMSIPVVVGAFPEPFLHGFDGKKRRAVVVGSGPVARRLARIVGGRVAAGAPAGANVLEIRPGAGASATMEGGVHFVVGARDAARLAADPHAFRFRYSVP